MTTATFRSRIESLPFTGEDVLNLNGIAAVPAGPHNVLIHCPCPDHADNTPSFSVNTLTGQGKCHGCGRTVGDVVALHRLLAGHASMGDALRDLEGRDGSTLPPPRPKPRSSRRRSQSWRPSGVRRVVKARQYLWADETPAFEVHRIQFRLPDGTWERKPGAEKPYKRFQCTHPGGHPKTLPDEFKKGRRRPLYRLSHLLALSPEVSVYITEGEPAADAVTLLGHVATTSSGGAGSAHLSDWYPLSGRRVVIWPDNDEPGRRYADEVRSLLLYLEDPPDIAFVDVPRLNLPPGGDAVDWVRRRKGDRS